MARQKVSVKNLRVGSQRIPDGIFRAIAAELLPGEDPTANQLKNGTPSKAMVLAGLCAVDPDWRRKTKAAAVVKMAAPLKRSAAEAGWMPEDDTNALAAVFERIEERDGRVRKGLIPPMPIPPLVPAYFSIESLNLIEPTRHEFWPYGYVTNESDYNDPAYIAARDAWTREDFDCPEWTGYKFTLADFYAGRRIVRKATAADVSIKNPAELAWR